MKQKYSEELERIQEDKFDFVLGIRPEDISIVDKKGKDNVFELKVELSELLGHELIIYSDIAYQKIIIKVPANVEMKAGDNFYAQFNEEKVHFFDLDTQKVIEL